MNRLKEWKQSALWCYYRNGWRGKKVWKTSGINRWYARCRNDRGHLIPILSHPMAQAACVSDTYHLRVLFKRLESDYQPWLNCFRMFTTACGLCGQLGLSFGHATRHSWHRKYRLYYAPLARRSTEACGPLLLIRGLIRFLSFVIVRNRWRCSRSLLCES